MIRFACPRCGMQLSAPEDCAGRSSKCRACSQPVTVPIPASLNKKEVIFTCPKCNTLCSHTTAGAKVYCPECGQLLLVPALSVQPPPCSPPVEEHSLLTVCNACGRAIAKEAVTCPGCGSPNNWAHPEIVRFYHSISQFAFGPSVQLTYEKFVLCGVDQRAHQEAQSLANLANSFGVIAPMNLSGLSTILAVRGGQAWASEWARQKIKAFRIDFTHSPASWASTDDDYWDDVMDFFRVDPYKKKRRKQRD
jgi:predicted RNA-binding Zn-ribbon protein involved in translation (DUF1610 family)